MTCTRTRVATFKSKRNTGKIVEDLEQVRITQQQHKQPPSRKQKQKQKQKKNKNKNYHITNKQNTQQIDIHM